MTYDPSVGKNGRNLSDFSEVIESIFVCIEQNDDVAYIVWNDKEEVVGVSQSINKVIGLTDIQLYGTKWKDSLTDDILNLIETYFYKCNKNSQIESIDRQFEKGNIKYKLTTLKVEDSRYYICRIKDLRYVKELEESIQQLQKGIVHTEKMAIAGEFATSLIHEIRNPLTSIKGFLQLAQAGIEQKDEYYRVMIDEVEKIEYITKELLMIGKPFSQGKQRVSLQQMVNDTIVIMKLQREFSKVKFEFNWQENSYVYCSEQQIKQVLINLLKNASEAMDKKGTVKINIEEANETIQLDIIDEGEGVPEDVILEIKKPFYTTKKTGTGLGLVVTNKILHEHGAIMDIFSEKGKGSKFTITFPKEKDVI